MPDGYRLIENQLNRPISWCPTLAMLLAHKTKRVDYPLHPRKQANTIERDSPTAANIRSRGRDGVVIHHASIPVWDLPKYSWEDGCVREVIKAVNAATTPSSRAHDFYLYDTFILHENQEQHLPLMWKWIGRNMPWIELTNIALLTRN